MKPSKRDLFIEVTSELMAQKGYHGTGLSEILKKCNAQRGSLYHYFPEGKDELTCAAIAHNVDQILTKINLVMTHQQSGDVAETMYQIILHAAEEADQGITTNHGFMTMASNAATTNERLRIACLEAFEKIYQLHVHFFLQDARINQETAEALTTFILTSIHGAMMGTKLEENGDTLRMIALPARALIHLAQQGILLSPQ